MNLSATRYERFLTRNAVRSVSQELGVNESLIHKWKRAAKILGNGISSGKEVSEIEVLRKRNRELEMEVEILKKATIYASSAEEVKTLCFY